MSTYAFAPRPLPEVPITGEAHVYPVARIFCVGRNYVAHAQEMGGEVDREAPWYFTKSAFSYAPSGATCPYPQSTANYHHEVELAFYMGAELVDAGLEEAARSVFGYSCALDMTRRDRQQDGKDHRRPWCLGKDVENSAVLAPVTRVTDFGEIGDQAISLHVNGDLRQQGRLSDMVWNVAEIAAHLSQFYTLGPGDVVLTGTPSGVGPVVAGDEIVGRIDGLEPVQLRLAAR